MPASVRYVVLSLLLSPAVYSQDWVPRGPAPIEGGQVEGMSNPSIVGAVSAIAPHPSDADIVYLGTTNGGIWRSKNATSPSPNWINLTANQRSLSIGAIDLDPIDQRHRTLVGGIAQVSSLARIGSARTGLIRTKDAGSTWETLTAEGDLVGLNISGIASRASTLVISVDEADQPGKVGIWRSVDSGEHFEQVSDGMRLPTGPSFDLVGDPEDPTILYTNAGTSGFFRSIDTGATWSKISNDTLNLRIANMTNCEFAVGNDNHVVVAVVRNQSNPASTRLRPRLSAVFHSADGGANWRSLGTPSTVEGGSSRFGLHPGGQGDQHLSIELDPDNSNIVYIGGDRQPDFDEALGGQSFPNSIGAQTYSARAFRGNVEDAANRWVHLTHAQSMNGGGTANSSSPHADCREMVVDANGRLLLGCDGGIYVRTLPQSNLGDWKALNGDLVATEFHAASWDAVSNIVVGGAQDNGSAESGLPQLRWDSIGGGDGAVTLVDDTGVLNQSTRYSSAQFLSGLRRRRFNANGQPIGIPQFVQKVVVNALGQPLFHPDGQVQRISGQFYTPLALNRVDTDKIVFGGNDTVYESEDQGDTAQRRFAQGGVAVRVNSRLGLDCLSYGAADNEDALYAGAGSRVFVRTAAPPQLMTESANYPGGNVQALIMDPDEFEKAFVADSDEVFRTTNAGAQWTNITNNLGNLSIGTILTIEYRPGSDQVIVGGQSAIASSTGPNFTNWAILGTGLPNVPVFHLEYDQADDLLLAGTLGRGAWTFQFP